MKKSVAITILVALFASCVSAPEASKKKAPVKKVITQIHEILDADEYVELDENSIKFLFTAKRGDMVNFYIGESKDSLKMIKEGVLAGTRGLVVDNLKPDTTYYYQIESIRDDVSIKTDILSVYKNKAWSWSPAEWAKDAIFYQIFVRSFYDGNGDGIGDFVGLQEKLPYLKELGVNAVWLMPINQSPSYHGYDVVDYYTVEKDYGTNEEFQELLKEAHANGIKIIMDLVINHSSTSHPWFQDSAKGEDSKYRNWYIWADDTDRLTKNGPFGGNQWHKAATGHYNGVFWSQMPDMNLRNNEVREEFKNIAEFWLDPNGDGDFSDGVDGFRLDAALHIDDDDSDVSHSWWKEFNNHVKNVNPDALLVGENWASTNKMASYYEDLDASFNFSFANNLLEIANGRSVDPLNILDGIHKAYSKYNDNYIDATFITNHDQNRGASVLGGDENKIKMAAAALLTMPGTPFIYYGEELGQLGKKPDDNIREPMDWYSDAKGIGMTTMTKGGFYNSMKYTKADDGISYQEENGVDGSILEYYKKLINIRKDNPVLFYDTNYKNIELVENLISYTVNDGSVNLLIAHNNTAETKEFVIDKDVTDLLSGTQYNAGESVILPTYTSVILK